jgi:predicted ribonuclease YlaK
MREPNRERKNDIKVINAVQLNEEQKEAKRLIVENQIVVITGRAGSGKSLVCAQAALDFLKKKQIECIYNTRAAVEVGKSLGFLPGDINGKFDPYMEALLENLNKCCSDKKEIAKLIEENKDLKKKRLYIEHNLKKAKCFRYRGKIFITCLECRFEHNGGNREISKSIRRT